MSHSVQQLDAVIQHNAASAEQMVAAAEALGHQAAQLQQTVEFFSLTATAEPAPAAAAHPAHRPA